MTYKAQTLGLNWRTDVRTDTMVHWKLMLTSQESSMIHSIILQSNRHYGFVSFLLILKNGDGQSSGSITRIFQKNVIYFACCWSVAGNWSNPKHQPKHKLEKWFIISDDGVRTYLRTKHTDQRVKPFFKLVLWWVLGPGSLYDSSLVIYFNHEVKFYLRMHLSCILRVCLNLCFRK